MGLGLGLGLGVGVGVEAELSTVIGADGLVAAAAASAPAFGCPPHRFLPLLYSGCMPPPKPAVPQ